MSQTTKWIVGVIIAVVVVAVGYSVIKDPSAPKETGPIKIGIIAPLSGEAASWGDNFLAGAELAKKEINDAGGVNGRLIEFVVEDDQCESAAGVSAINKLISIDKVDVIAGPVCSSVGGPALPIAQDNAVPTIIVASAPHLTAIGDYIFRTYSSDAFQGKFGAEFIYDDLGKRKAAVVYVKNDWGQGLRDVFVAKFKELGGEVVYDEGVSQDSNDLRTQISKIKTSGADVLYFPVYPTNAIAGLKQIKDLSLDISIVGADAFSGEEVLSSPGAEGVLYTVGKIDNPEDFIQKVKSLPGKEDLAINVVAPIGYDTIKAFAAVMESADTNAEKIKKGLNTLRISGISIPTIEFDEVGDLKTPQAEVMIIKNNKAETYSQ